VKVLGEGRNDTMVQLAVWTAAQLEKLNSLSGELVEIGIPLLYVEGHDWRGYIVYQEEEDNKVRQIVWGNDVFGDSSSILGIYKIVAIIRCLVHWSETYYTTWFKTEILQQRSR
jgi:hypothetical protein